MLGRERGPIEQDYQLNDFRTLVPMAHSDLI